MKLLDVVNQIQVVLPKYTGLLGDLANVSSVVATTTLATITTTAAHGLATGDPVTVANVALLTPISGVAKDGFIFTFTTAIDHDLTEDWHDTIKLNGFTDTAWNENFVLKSVPNRRTFTVQSTNVIPVLSGGEVLQEIRMDGVNGRYAITVTDPLTFTIAGEFIAEAYSGGTISAGIRVAGAVNLERALDQYTKQSLSSLWVFVTMHDVDVSKDRFTFSDATATKTSGNDLRLRVIDGFTVTFVTNSTDEIAGELALDVLRHTLFFPILKTIYGARFDSGVSGSGDFKTVLTGHGVAEYNKAILAYSYDFEMAMDITDNDAVDEGDTRAFRDLNYIGRVGGDDTTDLTVTINLDEIMI